MLVYRSVSYVFLRLPSGTNPMHPKCLHHIGTSTPRAARQQKNKSHLHSTLNYTRHENIRSSYWNPTTIYIWENKLQQVLTHEEKVCTYIYHNKVYVFLLLNLFIYIIYLSIPVCDLYNSSNLWKPAKLRSPHSWYSRLGISRLPEMIGIRESQNFP